MKCPYCKKEIGTKRRIINLLKKKDMIISEIANKLKLTRPVIYEHLSKLEIEGKIQRTKNKERKGAPVTIKILK